MADKIKQVQFQNRANPKSFLEILHLEDLLVRELDHDISKSHIIKFFMILVITDGSGYHTVDFTDYKYDKGSVLLIRKDQLQRFFKSDGAKGFVIVFTEDFIISHLNERQASKSIQLFNEVLSNPKIDLKEHPEVFENLLNLIHQAQKESLLTDEFSQGISRSIMHIIITKLFRLKSMETNDDSEKKHLSNFLKFQQKVEENCFAERKVGYYANHLGITTKTLNNIVQSVVRKSAKTFIDDITIVKIKRLLLGTNMSIKEIAYSAGFDETSNFFRYFKKYTGSTPEAFRLAHQ